MSLDTQARIVGLRYELQETRKRVTELEAELADERAITQAAERLRLRTQEDAQAAEAERDEARAEVERLRSFAEWVRDEPIDPVWSYTEQKRRAVIALGGDA